MGKTNKANRTKGNTRPSSSGHTAQLLGLDGLALNGFIGFNTLETEKASYVPVTGQQVADATDSSVDSDFRMVMRKMLKKDAVTRLKAMQEFGEYCVEKDKDTVKNVLPFWPRLFNKLALDYDRRIREATYQANGKLLSKVKREMAPYLKSVMGMWLLGQCDLYPPAASAAQATFETSFPETKKSDVVMFCRAEIFTYFKDNLFEQTAKTLSEPNSTTPEDMENRYTLVISATLQALKHILLNVVPSEITNLQNDFSCIVTENKFWKFPKSKEALIRGAWYTLISSICQHCSSAFAGLEKKLATTVFSALSESDPMVAPSVWESALSMVANLENCWQVIDVYKVALPQMWTILREGGKGNARVLFPSMLPFLSKLPKEILETENFLLQFFSCFRQSLSLELVQVSTIECDAIIKAFLECLKFICFDRLRENEMGPALLEKVLLDEVVPMIESSFYDPKYRHLSTSKLYSMLASFIRRIEKECLECRPEAYSKVLINFWKHLLVITYKIFDLPETEKSKCLVYLSYFFYSLLHIEIRCIKPKSVRFKQEDVTNALPSNDTPKSSVSSSSDKLSPEETLSSKENILLVDQMSCKGGDMSHGDEVLNAERNTISTSTKQCYPIKSKPPVCLSSKKTQSFSYIVEFCERLCQEIDSDCQLGYLRLLEEVLVSASNEDFTRALVRNWSNKRNKGTEDALVFCQEIFMKSLRRVAHDDDSYSCLFNMVFIICSSAPETEAYKILELCEKMNVKQLKQVLDIGLDTCRDAPFFQNWLKNSHWISEIIKNLGDLIAAKTFFSEAVSETELSAYLWIINVCVSDYHLDLLVDDTAFANIVLLVHDLVEQLFSYGLNDRKAQQALQFFNIITKAILKNTQRCWKIEATENLIFYLFCSQNLLSGVADPAGKEADTVLEIKKLAIDSYVQTNDISSETSLIYCIFKKVGSSIMSLETEAEASNVMQQCLFLLTSVREALEKHKPGQDSALFDLMDLIFHPYDSWPCWNEGLHINFLTSLLKKKTFYQALQDEKLCYSEDDIRRVMFACNVISGLLSGKCFYEMQAINELFHFKIMLQVMPALLWCHTFYKHCKITRPVLDEEFIKSLEYNYEFMLYRLKINNILEMLQKAILNLSLSNVSWALCLQTLAEMCNRCDMEKFAETQLQATSILGRSDSPHKCIVKQVLIKYLPHEKRTKYMEQLVDEIICLDEIDEDAVGKLGILCSRNNSIYLLSEDLLEKQYSFIAKLMSDYKQDLINEKHRSMIENQLFHLAASSPNRIYALEIYIDKISMLVQDCKTKRFDLPEDLLLLHQLTSLFNCISSFLNEVEDGVYTKLCRDFVDLFIYIADIFNNCKCLPESTEIVLKDLFQCIRRIPEKQLLSILINEEAKHSMMNKLIEIVATNIRPLQFAAQMMLIRIMPQLPSLLSDESKTPNDDDSDENIELIPSKLSYLIEQLKFLNELVESMLLDVKVGDVCTVVPHTDSYIYATGYLLDWIVMLKFISSSASQIRSAYATHLEESRLMSSLFCNVFRLMPENPTQCVKKCLELESPTKQDLKWLFLQPPALHSVPSSEEIQNIACYVFATALRKVPASIRTWWNNLDRKSADIVNSFTTKHLSSLLCLAEIQGVHENEMRFENLTVQARPGSREVIATYTIDECPIELCVQLPINYPLGPINAERRGKVVIGQLEWRHWLMQLTTVLTYQNGSILDGLTIWNRNLDKKFEGVEECMICYYILHNSTLKLPKLSCHVCRKKFHSACLYKWFNTSNNFTCPLCRNEFAV